MPPAPRSYLKQHRQRTAMQLLQHGAILFRGRSCRDLIVSVFFGCSNTWCRIALAGGRPHAIAGFPVDTAEHFAAVVEVMPPLIHYLKSNPPLQHPSIGAPL